MKHYPIKCVFLKHNPPNSFNCQWLTTKGPCLRFSWLSESWQVDDISCNRRNIVISWLYRTCWNNLATIKSGNINTVVKLLTSSKLVQCLFCVCNNLTLAKFVYFTQNFDSLHVGPLFCSRFLSQNTQVFFAVFVPFFSS
jgi:hypothetical protein